MPYALDLTSARAKLNRAHHHLESLRRAVGVDGNANSVGIPLRQQFEAERSSIVWRIESVINVRYDWALIVGDVVHNLRCALDHLAWQLAIRHNNGVVPTGYRHIRDIMFPIVMHEQDWLSGSKWRYIEPADADKLKRFQPFNITAEDRAAKRLHILENLTGFNGLDNVDKHRMVELASFGTWQGALGGGPPICTDCWPALGPQGAAQWHLTMPGDSPKPGDEVLTLLVEQRGPSPYVDFKAELTGTVLIRGEWNVFDALDAMSLGVFNILNQFA